MTTKLKISEVLRLGKALIDTESKWIQEVYALTAEGAIVDPTNPEACKFCSIGALYRAVNMPVRDTLICGAPFTAWESAYDYLKRAMHDPISYFNDTRTHARVLSAWDDAIALAEHDERASAP